MLLIAWLSAFTLCVALCRMAECGDAVDESIVDRAYRSTEGGLVVRDDSPEVALHDRRPAAPARLAVLAGYEATGSEVPDVGSEVPDFDTNNPFRCA